MLLEKEAAITVKLLITENKLSFALIPYLHTKPLPFMERKCTSIMNVNMRKSECSK